MNKIPYDELAKECVCKNSMVCTWLQANKSPIAFCSQRMCPNPRCLKDEIDILRREIDNIDRHIVRYLNQRFKRVRKIGGIKCKINVPVVQMAQRKEVIERAGRHGKYMPAKYYEDVFKMIVMVSEEVETL